MTAHEPSACFVIGSAVVFQPLNSPARATEVPPPFHTKATPSPVTAAPPPAAGAGAGAAGAAAPPTTTTEFLPPKPSSVVSFAAGSSFQVLPSITNL